MVHPGDGLVLVNFKKLYSPSLIVPMYRKDGSSGSQHQTLGDFGEDGIVVLPLSVLKEHIPSDSI